MIPVSAALLLAAAPAMAQPVNPFTGVTRLWLEWNEIPNTQWAPRSIDPEARPDKSLSVVKFQPVVPFRLNDDWTLVTRTVFRYINKPDADPVFGFNPQTQAPGLLGFNQKNSAGLNSVNPSFFFAPNIGKNSAIGFGPSLAVSINEDVGHNQFGVGPAVMAFHRSGRWTYGIRARQIWGVSNRTDNEDLNNLVAQPVLRYQLNRNWYLLSSPIVTADFNLEKAWTVPIGGGIGYNFGLTQKSQAMVSLEGYYNAIKPEVLGEEVLGDWTIRAQFQVVIPN